jgi:LPXTG-site transpeptidase (sortase) family protein
VTAPSDDAQDPVARPQARGRWLPVALTAFVSLIIAAALGLAVTQTPEPVASASPVHLAGAVGSQADALLGPGTPVPDAPETTTSIRPTTTTEDPGPLPEAPPSDPYAPTPQVVLGQIEIPKLGVVGNIQQGITLTAINRGPGHWPGTPMPGEMGNMVVAGHRTTYSKPFADLDQLVAGDQVVFRTAAGTFVYEVRGVIIVPQANIGIAAQNRMHTATLFACHPKGSATHRIVAKLKLLGPDGKQVDPEVLLPPVNAGADPHTGTTLMVKDHGAATTETDPLAGQDG